MNTRIRSLLSTIGMPVTAFHLPKINRIDTENFTGVKQVVRKEFKKQGQTVDEGYLDDGVLALKQYYLVALLDPKNKHAVSDMIDPFWHAHILHTDRYMAFCDEVFGHYLPHEPLDHDDRVAVEEAAELYRHTARVYGRLFSYASKQFYPRSVPEERLICLHNKVHTESILQYALFEAVEGATA